MYWDQGSEPCFGDSQGALYTEPAIIKNKILFSMSAVLTSVSDFVADIMNKRYNRKTAVIPNGVNTDFFHPAAKNTNGTEILLVGNPFLKFKRFSVATDVLKQLWNDGRKFKVRWICQHHPDTRGMPFPVEISLNPPQEQLAQLYANADILLFLSVYEGFGMPPLEAMASGLAVICSDCGGPGMYLKDGYNALVVPPEDKKAVYKALDRLISDKSLRAKLSANARLTALDFTLDKSYNKLETVLYAIKEKNKPD
jgi:glycosyltransferase involved in cell wall biosynthesis